MSLMTDRCAAMESNGKRCRRPGAYWASYHGDGEIYDYHGPEPVWVRVRLCKFHGKSPSQLRAEKKLSDAYFARMRNTPDGPKLNGTEPR